MNEFQPSLLELEPITFVQMPKRATIQQRFERFHAANPTVYKALRTLALTMLAHGVKQYGIKGLTEKLRWEWAMQTKGDSFKICNSYTSRYARLLIKENPELRDFFELRDLRERNCEAES